MRFHQESDDPRRPPNYFSRSVQYRLMVLVALFMIVLIMMEKVRDPKMWQWMWRNEQPAPAAQPPGLIDQGKVDTRLGPAPQEPNPEIPDAVRVTPPTRGPVPQQGSAPQRAQLDLWADLLSQLSREQNSLLDRALKRSRDGQPLALADHASWKGLIALLDEQMAGYLKRARDTTAQAALSAAEKERWRMILDEIRQQWDSRLRPALQSLAAESAPSEVARLDLQQLQSRLDELAMADIKDNTVLRPTEARAWFRLLERLQRMSPQEMEREAERVGYLQLFQQPDVYRGELVTIHGTAELGYRVDAPDNDFGIENYYILWVRPKQGPDAPLVVYCLDLPAGFPPVSDRDAGQGTTELSEEMDAAGYFFKNWAYRSREGISTAPLMLARAPQWTPQTPALVPKGSPASWPVVLLAVAAVAVLAVLLALLAYRTSRISRRPLSPPAGALPDLAQLPVSNTEEKLRRLSEDELPAADWKGGSQ